MLYLVLALFSLTWIALVGLLIVVGYVLLRYRQQEAHADPPPISTRAPLSFVLQPTYTPTQRPTSTPTATPSASPTMTRTPTTAPTAQPIPTRQPDPTESPVSGLSDPLGHQPPTPTPSNPRAQLPGYSSYGQAWGNWRTSIFETVGYKHAAASMGEHRTNGDLTDSPIRCLALDPWGAYLAISNDRVLYRVAADGSRHDILIPESFRLELLPNCLWSPDGLFLAVQTRVKARELVAIVPLPETGAVDNFWFIEAGKQYQTRLYRWTQDGHLVIEQFNDDINNRLVLDVFGNPPSKQYSIELGPDMPGQWLQGWVSNGEVLE